MSSEQGTKLVTHVLGQPHEIHINLGPLYIPRRVLGQGSYGVVVLAEHIETGERVAIKVVQNCLNLFWKDTLRLVRELSIQRTLKHANLLPIVDILKPPSYAEFSDLHIVTPLMDTTLRYIISSQQQLSEEHLQAFICQIVRGLAYMHARKVMHRDLKPENVLINQDCEVRLCDFGLARLESEEFIEPFDNDVNTTLTHYVVTRWYRAPELFFLSKGESYTSAIDMWSLGCILGELLLCPRKELFKTNDYAGQIAMIVKTIGPPPESFVNTLSNPSARTFLMEMKSETEPLLSTMFAHASPEAVDLLQRLLRFDPRERITAREALEHPFIAKVAERIGTSDINVSPSPDILPPDVRHTRGRELPRSRLKELLFEEIVRYHPEAWTEEQARFHDYLRSSGSSM